MNKRNFGKFSIIIGVVEQEWTKLANNPENYESSLEKLNEIQQSDDLTV